MSTNNKNNFEDQEIDLSILSNKIGGFFQSIKAAIYKSIQFIIKNIIIIVILFVIGFSSGAYLDKTQKTYVQQIIVQPNFDSTDYMYSKIDLLESKIRENDTVFLKSIGIQDPNKLLKIEVKPIIDIYKFITYNGEQKLDLLKMMSESGDISKIIEEKTTSKNYKYHLISFKTKYKTDLKKTLEPLLKYLNNSSYFSKIQKEYVNNKLLKIKANDITIAQIDGFLNNFTNTVNVNSKSDKLVYYNENSQLNDVIQTKDKLIVEQGDLRLDLVSLDKIIKENSQTLNIENKESVNGKLMFLLPILFIFIYLAIHYFISFYKKQSLINKAL